MMEFKKIIEQFQVPESFISCAPYGEGHINDTYEVICEGRRYILQRMNHHVFQHPEQLMSNIVKVTEHLRKKILESGGDPMRETLTVIPTRDNKSYLLTEDGNYFRMYDFIEGAQTYQAVEKPIHFYNAAKAFGRFQKLLNDFPAAELYETIPDFHHTYKRFEALKAAIEMDKAGRKREVAGEIAFALEREKDTTILLEQIDNGKIPLRVTHNDTKFNNIMIDDKSGEGICVIDLDTVMPGSLLYDYGDSLRFGANSASEDEKDLSKVYLDLNLFEQFTKGFIEEMGDSLTKTEREYMPFSAKLMTFECGIRFLADYLNGDTYFKIHYPAQNLDRARTQFKLVEDMEKKLDIMKQIVALF